MMRAITLVVATLASPALAQSPTEAMTRVWTTFQTVCKEALFDQNAFITQTPNPGPGGVTAVAQSPDGQIVEARRFPDNQMISLRITGTPTQRWNMCSAHDQGFDATKVNPAEMSDPAPWVAAFESIVRPTAPAPIVGGQIPIGFVARGALGEQYAQNDPVTHHYSSVFPWNGEEVIVTMIVSPFSLGFTGLRIERAQ